jgi:nitric oxide reductase NorQ protein
MNPYASEFAGTKPLNAAFRRRMTVWINFDYLSIGDKIAQEEVTMIGTKAGIPSDIALKVAKVGAELRRQYKTGDLPYGPSIGDLVNWARLISDGMSPRQSAEEAIVALTSDDSEVQGAVRRIVTMFFGSD